MTEAGKRRRGRPAKPEAERKSRNLNFRSREGLRLKLQQAAESAGRSISEEIEYRVDRSFESAFNPRYAVLFELIASHIALDEAREGKTWDADRHTIYFALLAARRGIDALIEHWTADWTARERVIAALVSDTRKSDAPPRPDTD
jgi:hypothetical protein